jgi:hypothetical protein
MTLGLRRGGTDDYDVIYDGETVGRIYRMKADRETHGARPMPAM